jgi:TRAP transporter 4TM/12TM fusion protein
MERWCYMAINIDRRIINTIAGLGGVYFLLVNSTLFNRMGLFIPLQIHRAISLVIALTLVYLGPRKKKIKGKEWKPKWYDLVLLLMGLVSCFFILFNFSAVSEYIIMGFLDTKGIILALILAASLLVAVKAKSGVALPIVVTVFAILPLIQSILPGVLHGRNYGIAQLARAIYIQNSGIFGLPLGVACTILIVFVMFGRMLQEIGGGSWITDIAMAIVGKSKGGTAKASILASSLFATISGSPGANVAATGSITIPLMRRSGFSSVFSGAVVAVASVGGQLMPPVMGAIAFLMAEWLQIPYVEVVKGAILPGVLFYLVLFVSAHFHTQKMDIGVYQTTEETIGQIMKRGWYFLIPIVVLLGALLFLGATPELSGIASIISIVLVSFIGPKEKRMTPKKFWKCLGEGTTSWVLIGVITATVGIMIASLQLSGLAIKTTSFLLQFSRGNVFITLILVGFVSLLMGMGLDSIPIYLTLVILTAPVLMDLGIDSFVSHLFVIYFGLASFITPPVCAAVYLACGISDGDFWKTGWQAVRLGICCFVVPFVFVYRQELLIRGSVLSIIFTFAVVAIGLIFIAAGLEGYFKNRMNMAERLLCIAGGVGVLFTDMRFWLPGLVLLGIGIVLNVITGKNRALVNAAVPEVNGAAENPEEAAKKMEAMRLALSEAMEEAGVDTEEK